MIQYRVIVHELAFSGCQGAPCPIGTFKGKRARQRALDAARAEAGDRVSITAVEVVQVGGAGDGTVVERIDKPGAYMPAGYAYCAGIYVDPRTLDIVGVYALSRDSREPHAAPPVYTFEVLSPATAVPDPTASRESILASLGVPTVAPAPTECADGGPFAVFDICQRSRECRTVAQKWDGACRSECLLPRAPGHRDACA